MSDVPPPVPPPPPPPPPGGFGVPAPIGGPTAGNAISYGWKKFQEQIGPILGVILIPILANVLIGGLGQFARGSLVVSLLLDLAAIVVGAVASYGIVHAALMITAGQQLDIARAFENDRWGEWIVFSVVFQLMIFVGLALCIIPGLFLLSIYGLAPYFFIDRRMSLGDSLTASQEAMKRTGIGWAVVGTIAFSLLGLLACCVGVLVTEAIAYIGVAMFYRYATNQPVAP